MKYILGNKKQNRINFIGNKKVAIIFYGLTKNLSNTVISIRKNILNPLTNAHIDYDIFIHTYKIHGKYQNTHSGEKVDNYNNENIEELLKPRHYIFDNQDDIIKKINFNEYYTKLGNWNGYSDDPEIIKYLIRNFCLALYSKKRIINVFEQYKGDYDYCIISRPDLEFKSKLDPRWLYVLTNINIIVPEKDWYYGINDRFCIGKPNIILFYGKLYNYLKEYSKRKSICSERYLQDMLHLANIIVIKKNIMYDTIRIK